MILLRPPQRFFNDIQSYTVVTVKKTDIFAPGGFDPRIARHSGPGVAFVKDTDPSVFLRPAFAEPSASVGRAIVDQQDLQTAAGLGSDALQTAVKIFSVL